MKKVFFLHSGLTAHSLLLCPALRRTRAKQKSAAIKRRERLPFDLSQSSLDNQLARYRAMEKDAKTLAQDHVLTVELIERLIERIEIDHERNIHVTFRFKNEFQGKAVEPCATM